MASHASERRAIQEWREAIFDEHERQPNFDELLVFLCEQANGRKSNSVEIWMEVLKLPFAKPGTSGEASAAVHSFISQAETLGLPTSEFGHVLSSLVLSKIEDIITPEGLHRITTTIANFYSKITSESQPAAAIIGNSVPSLFYCSKKGSKISTCVISSFWSSQEAKGVEFGSFYSPLQFFDFR